MKRLLFALLSAFSLLLSAQDSLFTRQVISTLSSKKYFGRGYVKNGLHHAEKFLVAEIKKTGAMPFFGSSYLQPFRHPVNTFPSDLKVTLNGKKLKTGYDFIPSPGNGDIAGKFLLEKTDSITFRAIGRTDIGLVKKRKLTWSVAGEVSQKFVLEVDASRFPEDPQTLTLKCRSKFNPSFESKNIACFIPGAIASDSAIVFTAHYDHLGGIGKNTFFPGANDNASGVSMLLNLMHYYATHKPKYKTVFIFFAGEEAGLLGSRYFTESRSMDLSKIKFLLNLDLLGTGEEGIMVVNGSVFEKHFEKLENINNEQNLLPSVRKRGRAANSDHYWFTEQGVPCFFIYTMGGIKAYHDVYDVEKTLPLSHYSEVFKLLISFIGNL